MKIYLFIIRAGPLSVKVKMLLSFQFYVNDNTSSTEYF